MAAWLASRDVRGTKRATVLYLQYPWARYIHLVAAPDGPVQGHTMANCFHLPRRYNLCAPRAVQRRGIVLVDLWRTRLDAFIHQHQVLERLGACNRASGCSHLFIIIDLPSH